jgi:hypothetical protein
LEKLVAEKQLEFFVHTYADRVMARVEQDGVHKDESDKKAKSVNAEKVNRPRRTKAAKCSRKDPLEVGDICTV